MSTLWKYLKCDVNTPLPLPNGSLSGVISTSGIVLANKEFQKVIKESEDGTLHKRALRPFYNLCCYTLCNYIIAMVARPLRFVLRLSMC